MKAEEVINSIEGLDLFDKIDLIFRWHNGLVIEDWLNSYTEGTSNYKFIPGDMQGNFVFSDGDKILTFDEKGNFIREESDFYSFEFESKTKHRLMKTNEMMDRLTAHREEK